MSLGSDGNERRLAGVRGRDCIGNGRSQAGLLLGGCSNCSLGRRGCGHRSFQELSYPCQFDVGTMVVGGDIHTYTHIMPCNATHFDAMGQGDAVP